MYYIDEEDLKRQLDKANDKISKQQEMIDDMTALLLTSEGICVSL